MSSKYRDLVVVACHAIFLGNPETLACDVYSPLQWNLQPFQQPCGNKPGEHETFLRHIQAGLDILSYGAIKDSSILIFSGGVTASRIKLSEARSYYNAAVALTKASARTESCTEMFGSRILLEENATDSFQNLLFSILLFRRTTGNYPETITVITHAFKTERFMVSHLFGIFRIISETVLEYVVWKTVNSDKTPDIARQRYPMAARKHSSAGHQSSHVRWATL